MKEKFQGRFIVVFMEVAVLALALGILVYIGYGDAYRTYSRFEIDKLLAQGEVVRHSMETFLKAGLPVEEFVGFKTRTNEILESDPSIMSIAVVNTKGRIVHSNPEANTEEDEDDPVETAEQSGEQPGETAKTLQYPNARVLDGSCCYQAVLPLYNKFETVGDLRITMSKAVAFEMIGARFFDMGAVANRIKTDGLAAAMALNIPFLGLALLAVFAAISFFRPGRRKQGWIAYGLTFLLMSGIVLSSLVHIYTVGIERKTKALADSLRGRLGAALEMKLDLTEFEGIGAMFEDYRKLDPDISYIAFTSGDTVLIDSDRSRLGKQWESRSASNLERRMELTAGYGANKLVLYVGIPKDLLYGKLWRCVKNFLVLFIAVAFLAVLFFNLRNAISAGSEATDPDARTNAIQPFYFLGVFAEALCVSFLPQYLKQLAAQNHVDPGMVSTLFTSFFAAFVAALIPSGIFAERRTGKPLLIVGALCSAVGFLLMVYIQNFYAMYIVRILCGLGQGMFFIGVQTHILEHSAPDKRTQSAAIIVYGYNGGMISGTAIGALLVTYTGPGHVFAMAGIVALAAACYAFKLIPAGAERKAQLSDSHGLRSSLSASLRDADFIKAILFIGMPAKAVLTGITIFALPLLLSRLEFVQEDIGQIIMFYAAGVLISSRYIAKWADRKGKTGSMLFVGTVMSGLGLILIGLIGTPDIQRMTEAGSGYLTTLMLITGVTVLGLAHGFIHAPIVTYIAGTAAAAALGRGSATSLYRFLERMGHVLGPVVVGALFAYFHESALTIAWVGIGVIVFGFLFLVRIGSRPEAGSCRIKEA